jgi:electron transport complex protein RnfB
MSAHVARPRRVARIDEQRCIGCTLCIQACPVDAIVGAVKLMHTVMTDLCIGCDLCVAPCPVECIAMLPASGPDALWNARRARAARERARARRLRLSREAVERGAADAPDQRRHAAIRAAVERARARRAAAGRTTKSAGGSRS